MTAVQTSAVSMPSVHSHVPSGERIQAEIAANIKNVMLPERAKHEDTEPGKDSAIQLQLIEKHNF